MTTLDQDDRARITALEEKVRRLQGLVVGLIGALGVGALVALRAPDEDLVARSLRIVDLSGVTRIALETDGNGAALRLLDGQGTTRAELTAADPEVRLSLRDGVGSDRMILSQGFTEQSLELRGVDGGERAALRVSSTGRSLTLEPGLGLFLRAEGELRRVDLVTEQ